MDNIGEGDVDLIKAPIVIDNVSQTLAFPLLLGVFTAGIGHHEGWTRRRVRALSRLQLIVSTSRSIPFHRQPCRRTKIRGQRAKASALAAGAGSVRAGNLH